MSVWVVIDDDMTLASSVAWATKEAAMKDKSQWEYGSFYDLKELQVVGADNETVN